MSEPSAVVTTRGAERISGGHLWIYRSDVRSFQAEPGDLVRVSDERGRLVGRAFWSDRSQIALRFLTRRDEAVDREFFAQRIRAAAAFRQRVVEDTDSYRLVYGEADLLPSLIVDRYGDLLVIQTLSQGTEKRKGEIVEILKEQFSPRGILERNDPKARLLEGMQQTVSVLHGEVPEEAFANMNGVRFRLDLRKGQKTGVFLDQRENYRAAAQYLRGEVLDCFSYHGGFALHAARQAQSVEAVDSSGEALALARANVDLNGTTNITFREANVFDVLKEYDQGGRRFDAVILDPPAFAKSRTALDAALRGYKEINLRALRLLRPGGVLVTCSCSYHVSEALFGEMLWEASVDVGQPLRVLERRGASRDHPMLLTVPETLYLKCMIMMRMGA
ncbi:MAG TPA: class I SAM-dependent rRNA methyltransferase [Candidatus Acidoferrales bacterium]|nr:class I SAM-dependent rRNA methyltransferase [Candidatus Acidoferrales bacterium]